MSLRCDWLEETPFFSLSARWGSHSWLDITITFFALSLTHAIIDFDKMVLSNEFGHFKEQNSSDVEFDDQTTSIIELGKTD